MAKKCLECNKVEVKTSRELCPECINSRRHIHVCWKDNTDKVVRECTLRVQTAQKYFVDGKPMPMPECLICGETEDTTPKPPAQEKKHPLAKGGEKRPLCACGAEVSPRSRTHKCHFCAQHSKRPRNYTRGGR